MIKSKTIAVLVATVIALSASAAWAQNPAPQSSPPTQQPRFEIPGDVVERKVDIWSEGTRMTGRVYTPKAARPTEKLPTILLASGWGGAAIGLARNAVPFAQAGYMAVTFDYRGWGESDSRVVLTKPVPADKVGNRFTAEVQEVREVVEPINFALDWQNALHWLRGEPQCDPDRIGLWGTSFSGGLVAYVAARDQRVKAIYSQVGAFDGRPWANDDAKLRDELTKRAHGELELPAPRARYTYEAGGGKGGLNGWPNAAQFHDYAPIEEIKRLGNIAMLIVTAENEELFDDKQHGQKAYATHVGPDKKLVIIPGITHYGIYSGAAAEQGRKLSLEWFDKYVKNAKK